MQMTLLLAIGLVSPAASEPITVFDLTPALQYDLRNPQLAARAWDEAHIVATLQGIVNRDRPRLYIRFVVNHGVNVDDYWMDRMIGPGEWLAGRRFVDIPNLNLLVRKYRRLIKGAVVYDPAVPATSNLASTIAGVENLIAVRYDPSPKSAFNEIVTGGPRLKVVRWLVHRDGSPMFTGQGTIPDCDIPSTGSAKCDAYLWLKHHYIDTGKVDAGFAGYYMDSHWLRNPLAAAPNQHTVTNHDFFVAKRAFFFDLNIWDDEVPVDDPNQKIGTDCNTFKAILASAYEQAGRDRMIHIGGFTPWAYKYTSAGQAGGKHEPVPTEWKTAEIISAYNAYIDADAIGYAAMANASFFMHFPLKQKYPQPWVTRQNLSDRGYLTSDGKVDFKDREFMIFYVGDYDAAAWVYQNTHRLWDHPDRGKIPLMWCISPVLERRAAVAMDYMRRTATENDYFAAADNGAGYLNPGVLQEPRPYSQLPSGLDTWGRHCRSFYGRWDITITGFVIDGYAPGLNSKGLDCYASFSGNGIVPQKIPATLLHDNMPVLRAGYDLGDDPVKAASIVVERIKQRTVPFHWFRAILKSPDWYIRVYETARQANRRIELLDAPTFFELYRIWLQNHPAAARGEIESPR